MKAKLFAVWSSTEACQLLLRNDGVTCELDENVELPAHLGPVESDTVVQKIPGNFYAH